MQEVCRVVRNDEAVAQEQLLIGFVTIIAEYFLALHEPDIEQQSISQTSKLTKVSASLLRFDAV